MSSEVTKCPDGQSAQTGESFLTTSKHIIDTGGSTIAPTTGSILMRLSQPSWSDFVFAPVTFERSQFSDMLTVLFVGGALPPILMFTVFDSFPNCYSSLFMADLARSTRNQPRRDCKPLHTGKSTLGKSDIVENHTALADEQGPGRSFLQTIMQSITPKSWHVKLQNHIPATPVHTPAVINRQEIRPRRNLSEQFSPGTDHLSPVEERSEEEVDEEDVIGQLEAEIADPKRLYEIN